MRRWRCGAWLVGAVAVCGVLIAPPAWSSGVADQGGLVIRVWKARHMLWLQQGNRIIKKFPVALGRDPLAGKIRQGDGLTPEGRYYISEKKADSPFHRFLGLSYPNINDAERAYAAHLISADEWADIFYANLEQTTPPWATPLGGRVGIHGYGDRPYAVVDWTEGCIAVSNGAIDYLYDHVPVGTPVIISNDLTPPATQASTTNSRETVVGAR